MPLISITQWNMKKKQIECYLSRASIMKMQNKRQIHVLLLLLFSLLTFDLFASHCFFRLFFGRYCSCHNIIIIKRSFCCWNVSKIWHFRLGRRFFFSFRETAQAIKTILNWLFATSYTFIIHELPFFHLPPPLILVGRIFLLLYYWNDHCVYCGISPAVEIAFGFLRPSATIYVYRMLSHFCVYTLNIFVS